jgi:hypothetical protein
MKQLLIFCTSIIEATDAPILTALTNSIFTENKHGIDKVVIDSNDAILTVEFTPKFNGLYTETTVSLKQYADRPPVEVIEELTKIAESEWKECNSECLIDNKIKNLLKK